MKMALMPVELFLFSIPKVRFHAALLADCGCELSIVNTAIKIRYCLRHLDFAVQNVIDEVIKKSKESHR
jgi:hypothetical protein